MNNKILFLSLLLSILFCTPALTQRVYVGGSVGNGFNNKKIEDINGDDFKFKESNLAWKVYASTGWRFLGLEGGYRDFGEIEKTTALGNSTSRTRGGDIFGKGVVNIGRTIFAFGKAGWVFTRTKNIITGDDGKKLMDEKDRETAFAWGLGGGLNLGKLQLRLEYENVEISNGNLGMLSIGAAIGFDRERRGRGE